jgi:tetratricopeptide (TPR) repeat protein
MIPSSPGTGGGCLDAELLAAYIDGRVTTAERSEVEAHLAGCESCHFVFAESFRESAERIPEAPASDRRWWSTPTLWRTAAGLAAAAAVVIAVRVSRDDPRNQVQPVTVALNELQAVSGPYRPFEGRLSDMPTYRPPAAPVRSGSTESEVQLAVREAALKVELAARQKTLQELRALAIMHLTMREPQRAADVLGPAVKAGSDPALLNDLAVALLASGRPEDRQRAKELLEQVIARDPTRAEAYFNLGLAAEATGDATRAREAWSRYLALDPSSPWAAEARARLEKPGGSNASVAPPQTKQD